MLVIYLTTIASVALIVAAHTLVSLCRLGKLHNELGAMHDALATEFRAFRADWDYDGEPIPDDEIADLVRQVTAERRESGE